MPAMSYVSERQIALRLQGDEPTLVSAADQGLTDGGPDTSHTDTNPADKAHAGVTQASKAVPHKDLSPHQQNLEALREWGKKVDRWV